MRGFFSCSFKKAACPSKLAEPDGPDKRSRKVEVGYKHPGCIECEVELPTLDGKSYVSFDWKTVANEYLEVKDINWSSLKGDNLERARRNFISKNNIIQRKNGIFIVYSKQSIPESWKTWFFKNHIEYRMIG